jgi:hypothetical protein
MALPAGVLYELLCIHAQQAAEKSLKAVLIHHGIAPPRTHNLARTMRPSATMSPPVPRPTERIQPQPRPRLPPVRVSCSSTWGLTGPAEEKGRVFFLSATRDRHAIQEMFYWY